MILSESKQHWFRKPLKSLGVIRFIVLKGSLQVLWGKWLRRESFYCYFIMAFEVVCLVYYFSFQDSPAVIWPFSTWSTAQWLLPFFLHCSVPLSTCLVISSVTCSCRPQMPALPTTSGNPPAHILMDPSEADFDTAPHTFIDSLSYLASALEWFHATSLCPHCVPFRCPRNWGTKWKRSISSNYN